MKYKIYPLFSLWFFCLSVAVADDSYRLFQVYSASEAGLEIYKPTTPEWKIDLNELPGNDSIVMWSPDAYYPPTSLEIRLNQQYKINKQDLSEMAVEIANTLRKKSGIEITDTARLKTDYFGKIHAVTDQFNMTVGSDDYSFKHVIGIMPSGHVVTMLAATPSNEIDSIDMMLNKIYANLKELNYNNNR